MEQQSDGQLLRAGVLYIPPTDGGAGRLIVELPGELAAFEPDSSRIVGGQVDAVRRVADALEADQVTVYAPGVGGFAPCVVRAALRQAGSACRVSESAAIPAHLQCAAGPGRCPQGLSPIRGERAALWTRLAEAGRRLPHRLALAGAAALATWRQG